jgi:signal peptide peptidase SppA
VDAFDGVVRAATLPDLEIEVNVEVKVQEAELTFYATAPACAEARVPRLPKTKGQVAVIPMRGVIGQHPGDYWADVYTDRIEAQVAQMQANPAVGAIVLDIDSPGGIVYGTPELSAYLRGLRDSGAKPIYAAANAQAASAAYWLGSAATKLFVTPSGEVGSIGVWNMHIDASEAWKKFGAEITLIFAGKYKVEGHPFGPLDDEARAELQRGVDDYYGQFLTDVAAGRRVSKSTVEKTYGQGRTIEAERAKSLGMVDGVATLGELLAGLLPPASQGSRRATAAAAIAIEEAEE